MKRLYPLLALVILMATHTLKAQTPTANPKPIKQSATAQQIAQPNRLDTVKNSDPSLAGQYRFLLSRSKTINTYKIINPYRLSAFYKSVTDTLTKERAVLATLKKQTESQAKTIAEMDATVNESKTTAINNDAKVNEISFLGISINKDTYSIIVWTVIALLVIGLVLALKRSTSYISDAQGKNELYEELSAEYQQFKAKSKERERKLARELQDERNIVEELQQNKKK